MTCNAQRHNTVSSYFYGCRCPEAREAMRLYRKRRAHGLQPSATVSSLGAGRRLRALVALGWTQAELAARLDVSKQNLNEIVRIKYPTITAGKCAKITRLYEQLCGTPGPSRRARMWASSRGWLPPLAWEDIDDPAEVPAPMEDEDLLDGVAIERACRRGVGRVALSEPELAEVRRRLVASSLPSHEVASLLEVNVRTVDRWRASTRPGMEAA